MACNILDWSPKQLNNGWSWSIMFMYPSWYIVRSLKKEVWPQAVSGQEQGRSVDDIGVTTKVNNGIKALLVTKLKMLL